MFKKYLFGYWLKFALLIGTGNLVPVDKKKKNKTKIIIIKIIIKRAQNNVVCPLLKFVPLKKLFIFELFGKYLRFIFQIWTKGKNIYIFGCKHVRPCFFAANFFVPNCVRHFGVDASSKLSNIIKIFIINQ